MLGISISAFAYPLIVLDETGSPARAGLVGLTRSLAKELGPDGVRVNLVAPGPLTPDGVAPRDVATVVLFLASDDAAFITGETFPVDGGRS